MYGSVSVTNSVLAVVTDRDTLFRATRGAGPPARGESISEHWTVTAPERRVMTDADTGTDADARVTANGILARYEETDDERVLSFERDGRTAAVAQNREGYAMLKVRPAADGDELERYYGFDMALDHAAELLGVGAHDLPVPDPADDMGI